MRKTELVAYLELLEPTVLGEGYKEYQKSMIDELCDSKELLVCPLQEYGQGTFDINYIPIESIPGEIQLINLKEKQVLGINNPATLLKTHLLKIKMITEIPSVVPQTIKDNLTKLNLEILKEVGEIEFNVSMMYEIFKKRIYDLLFACNLSKFGSLSVNKFLIFQDNNNKVMAGSSLDYKDLYKSKLKISEWKYPELEELNIIDVWSWLTGFPDFLIGFSESPTTRALINLNEISKSDDNMKLFRAVMGLESLYTKGNASLQEQVREKSQIVLGKQEGFKKLYNSMYNFRSKFIHGEQDFPNNVHLDMSGKADNYSDELEEAISFAILILGASIQQLIIRNWKGYTFEYVANNI